MENSIKYINTPEELREILGKDINNGQTKGNTYHLGKSLDCSTITDFIPLGSGAKYPFEGIFDGKGYSITNLTIAPLQAYELALIAKIGTAGEVKNVRLENLNILQSSKSVAETSTVTHIGSIAAVCQGKIESCCATGKIYVQTRTDSCRVGGICGSLPYQTSEIIRSWADIFVSFPADQAEGRRSESPKMYYAGGIAGSSNGKISACHSRSEISPPDGEMISYIAGGLCGIAEDCSVMTACYNIGYLHSRADEKDLFGGIAGSASDDSVFSKCFYLKNCILSKKADGNNTIGIAKNWAELVQTGFASAELSEDYMDTPADNYTYTPALAVFASSPGNVIHAEYLKALCTPSVTSFTQAVYPETTNPVKIECKLNDCNPPNVSMLAVKPDKSRIKLYPAVSGTSFSCDLGNNNYISCDFVLTLTDRYERTIALSAMDIAGEDIVLPHIENPSVNTDNHSVKADDLYAYYKYHWVGNGPAPDPEYSVSAIVAGAVHIALKQTDGKFIAEKDIPFSKVDQKIKLRVKTSLYKCDTLIFTVENETGMQSSITWKKEHQEPDARRAVPLSENKWQYPLKRLTWSLTNRCNLNCRHCSPHDIYNGMHELCGEEIGNAVQDIIHSGISKVCLTGGEVLLSPHWYETAETLSQAGAEVSLITNGTLINKGMAEKIKSAGISYVSVSIDDFESAENTVRDKGCYYKALQGVKYLKSAGMPVSIITTVHALNIDRLDDMRNAFSKSGADTWGLKPLLPYGTAVRNEELWLDERDINKILDFCYTAVNTAGLPVIPSLSIEMHSEKGAAIHRSLYGEEVSTECYGSDAGIFSAQLHPDGSLVGICVCTPAYSAGNITERSLSDIWEDKNSFKVLRNFNPDKLGGYCGKCERRNTCKGGDLNTRLAFGGVYAENKFCVYRNMKLYGTDI